MGWSTLVFQTFLFIGERILGVVDNLVAGEVWPRVKHMGCWSVALLIGLLLAPFVVVISDRVRKERRRMSENNQILDLVGGVGSQVSQTIYHSLNHSQTRSAVDRPPLSVQSDNVRQRERDSRLLDAQRPAPSDEDLQSVRYVSEAIVEIRATVSQHAQSATERDNQATERHNQLQNDIIKLQNDVVKLKPLILKLLDRFPSESMVFYSRNQVNVDADAEQKLRNTLQPNTESHSSKVFHKKVALKDQGSKAEWAQQLSLQLIRSMQLAYQIDKDYTFQIGSLAIAKYTDDGLQIRMLREDSVPTISDCERSSSVSDLWSGGLEIWIIKGYNLEGCELRAATAEKSETLEVLHQFKTSGGMDVLICEEPSIIQKSAPMFRDKIHIIASKIVEDVEEMVSFKLQSEAISVKETYEKAVADGFTPSLWLAISESVVLRYNRNNGIVNADAEHELRITFGPDSESHGSKVFYKKVARKDPGSKAELEQLLLQVIRSMQLAYEIDKDCTLQFGSIAIAKYTDDGLKIWMLKEDWAPQILDCERSSWSLSDLMSGGLAIWTIKGLNLEGCELRAATAEKSETLKVLHLFKTNGGVDVLICEEPSIIQNSAPIFRDKIHIIASKTVEDVEQMVTFKLQSEAVSVKTAYGKAVVDGLKPSLWLAILLLVIIGATSNFWDQLGHLDTTVGLNFKDNSAVSYMWGKLPCYEMFLLYVLAILIPDMFARLWLLLQESFQPLGAAIVFYARTLAFARKQGSKIRCIFSSSSCAARTPYNIKEVSDQHQRLIEELWTPDCKIKRPFSSRSCATSRSDCLKELRGLKEISERLKALKEPLKESSELRQRSMEEFLLGVDFRRTSCSSSCAASPPDDKKTVSVHHQLTTAEQPWPIPMGSPFSSSFHAASPPNDIKKLNDSVYEFYKPNGRPTMEIVFFHGLQLHAHEDAHRKTWLCMDEETLWPQQWLSKEFPCARILSISYDSSAVKSSSQGRLDMDLMCENLVNDIILDSTSNVGQNCPVVLVGHCVGGLLIKALCNSLNRKKHLIGSGNYDKDIKSLNIFLEDSKGGVMKEIALSVIGRKSSFKSANRDRCQREVRKIDTFMGNMRGVFFYGTPHLGSTLADLPPRVPSTSPLLEYFRILQVETAKLNEHFSQQRLRYGWRTYGMAEGQRTNFKGFNGMVVEEASARFDMDESYTATSSDHFTVCRPRATNDPAFTELSRFIVSLLSGSVQISIV